MELSDLKIFIDVVQNQSISRAAAGLHMGQPAVSQRIMALESEIGKPLFVRHRRGVRLTEPGKLFLEYAQRVTGLVEEGTEAVRNVGASAVRVHMIGPSSVNGYFLPPLLERLHVEGCLVTLRDAHSHEVMQYVLDGSIDAGFVLGAPVQPGVRRTLIHQDPIVCVAGASHPLVKRSTNGLLRIADLAPHNLILYPFSHDFDSLVHTLESAYGEPLTRFMQTTPAESVKAMLMAGEYISFLPRMTVQAELKRGEVAVVPITDFPVYTWDIAMVYRERKEQTDAVTAVLKAANALWQP